MTRLQSPRPVSEPPLETVRDVRPADVRSTALPWRTKVNFWLDFGLLAMFTALATIGALLRFVFPIPSQSEGYLLWGYGYDGWSTAWHNVFAVFALLILVHVMLHWSWVCGVAGRLASRLLRRTVRVDDAVQTIYGVGLLMLLLGSIGVVVASAVLSIQAPQ